MNHPYLELALKLARLRLVERPLPKFCCVLTDNKTNTFIGYNSYKTHPLQQRFNLPTKPCLHAEMDAIRQAIRLCGTDLKRFTMYVARVHRSGQQAMAKPCPGCQSAIMAFNVKEVKWTDKQ